MEPYRCNVCGKLTDQNEFCECDDPFFPQPDVNDEDDYMRSQQSSSPDVMWDNGLNLRPFCGSHNVKSRRVYVICLDCRAEGPGVNHKINDEHVDFMDEKRAIELWNKRV